jgi:ADP-dependent NAD(P)H-hydrate dehydratase
VTRAIELTRRWLASHPLPMAGDDSDKDARGRILVVGGSTQVPGAVLLAGIAALRSGAGKLQLATVASAALTLGVAVPEALVVALPETRSGEIKGSAGAEALRDHARDVDALLIGPGMTSERSASALVSGLVRRLSAEAVLVLDAAALMALHGDEGLLHPLMGRAVITPHAGEMASLLGIDKDDVERDAANVARVAAERFGVVVALKGAESWIAEPDGRLAHYAGGSVGLATSGSGDTLAGIVGGLAARGASPLEAAAWGAHLHGSAGRVLARRMGRVGFLARELLDEIPALMRG